MKINYCSSLALLAVLSLTACNNEPKKQEAATQPAAHTTETPHQQAPPAPVANPEPAASIPEFTFYKVKSGMSFSKADIKSGRNSVFILFDPSCGHCQHEAAGLAKNYSKVKDINIYYVSMNDPALMVKFFPTFAKELEGKDNVELLYDKDQNFIQKFHVPKQFPANYIYGTDGQLKGYWDGEKDINEAIAAFTK
ncbi:TlpA family protein disulfide reductase [Sphingobacterium hungaricum]|uniref:Thioredoxin domain-containing protein n=1 Tax=Sphingobacterium hungaricum TaxID=2082723 RepID=A0A928YNK6_9SPHI|nr:redoxin domain-containing protein [Sphingobacterium hungaricum]MBE8712166.1 hypothetical protein [Sphingobacterium hungaricum]